ncbi:MAG: glycosyltransferase family 2 protein [Chloroflexi bacterium]|nr:MAG: glycosyltransferase family 2 protein [Chloroflexota bacterium]
MPLGSWQRPYHLHHLRPPSACELGARVAQPSARVATRTLERFVPFQSPAVPERGRTLVGNPHIEAGHSSRISVVIPALNEARNLPFVLEALPPGMHEVILVDGHSVDGTMAVAQRVRPGTKIVQQTRRGKGNALACGFAQATGDIIVMLDADGSADPCEIPLFVAALHAGADFAKGTRFAWGGASRDITRFRRLGNAALNRLVNLLYRTHYTDLCYGYNAFWRYLLPVLDLPPIDTAAASANGMVWGDGFEIETLINVRAAHTGARITEVGSTERARLHGVSNLNAIQDGFRVLRTILAERRRVSLIERTARNTRPHSVKVPADGLVDEKETRHAAGGPAMAGWGGPPLRAAARSFPFSRLGENDTALQDSRTDG